MATYAWYGNTTDSEGEFEEVANWRGTTGAASAEYAGQTQADDIVFDGQAAMDLSADGEGATAQADMDQSASPFGVTNLTIRKGFAYGIGGPRCPLILKTAGSPAWSIDGPSSSDLHIVSVTGTVASFEVLRTNTGADALHLLFATAAATAGRIVSGNVTLDGSLGGQAAAGVATLIVDTSPGDVEPVVIINAPVTTKLVVRGGTVYWQSGTLTALEVYGGTFSARRSTTGPTLTNGKVYGGEVDLRTGGADLTVTNAMEYFGGEVQFNPGQSIEFT